MNTNHLQLKNFRKFLLSRQTVTSQFITFVENCIISEDDAAKHCFHKIMIHHWSHTPTELFENLAEYLASSFIPIQLTFNAGITSFYTNNLNLILKIMKMEFMFPSHRTMYNIDILFYDKTSHDCFGSDILLDDIISQIVSQRFNEKFELDLSNFCNEAVFSEKKIFFYKLGLLAIFKILMIRMARDTRLLKLNNNELSTIPSEIMNFFIKGDLLGIDLSNNNISSMSELRILSKVERLWLEGNPICDCEDVMSYVKQITLKYPRLRELDGIPVNKNGIIFPFWKNFAVNSDRKTRMLAEKFVTLYFTHYDDSRRNVLNFYHKFAKITISTNFNDTEEKTLPHYAICSRNIQHPEKRKFVLNKTNIHDGHRNILGTFLSFPETTHDPKSFNIDVLKSDKKSLIIVVDGVYQESNYKTRTENQLFQFRRTFVFEPSVQDNSTVYYIVNEMFTISFASKEQIDNSFKMPTRNLNTLMLLNPDKEEIDAICTVFCHISNLKPREAELRLRVHNWDIRKTLLSFEDEIRNNKITNDNFVDSDLSDLSSLGDELD